MIDKDSANNRSYVVDVKILDVEKRYKPGPKHYVYVIQVNWTNPTNIFIIYRRYAQFFDLQCKLLDLFAEAPSPSNNYKTQKRQIPFLPGKIFLGRSQIRQIALERKHALNIYCQTLISLPESLSRSRPVLEFFQPLSTDVQNPTEFLTNNNKKSITKDPTNISQPLKLPTYRCLDDFLAVDKTEMSLKRNTLVQVIQRQLNGWWFVQNGDRTGFVPGAFLKPIDNQDIHEMKISTKSSNELYVVNKSYEAKSRDEISLDQGSFITVLEKSYTGWWIIQFNNITGQFPAVYLTSCKGRILPENILKEVSPISSNSFIRRLSCLNDYEQNDNDESLKDVQPELYYVCSDFFDDVGDCVSLQRGDIVEIHEKHSSGWWYGRRLKDDFVLTWIPSAFLQKEPVFNTSNNETQNSSSSSSSELYLNVVVKEKVPKDNIYQNTENQLSKGIIYTEVLQKEQPIIRTVTSEQSSLTSNDNEKEPTIISVRDLVKKFNRQ